MTDTTTKFPEIFKIDSKGKTRVWYMEQSEGSHRTVSGIHGGNLVESAWTQCEPTNVGKSNERLEIAQATFEIEAAYEKKLSREYHRSIESAKQNGAHFFKPMLAKEYKPDDFRPGYAQPKLDGVRCIATKSGMFSRQGKELPGAKFIHEQLAPLFEQMPDLILDGELYNHNLKDDFNSVIRLVRKKGGDAAHDLTVRQVLQYHVYDVPSVDEAFYRRKGFLEHNLRPFFPDSVHMVETMLVNYQDQFDEAHAKWIGAGYEGSMWRDSAPYEQKRSKYLLKRKDFQDEEFEVVRIEEGTGNWAGAAKSVICRMADGKEFGAGIKGSYARGQELLNEQHKVVTVRYFELTPDGVPRFGIATQFHGEERDT